MTKKLFRVQLFTPSISMADALILAAARSNANDEFEMSLEGLKSVGEGLKKQFQQETDSQLLIVDNTLFVEAKFNDNWKCVAVIEEIEVFGELVVTGDDENNIDRVF